MRVIQLALINVVIVHWLTWFWKELMSLLITVRSFVLILSKGVSNVKWLTWCLVNFSGSYEILYVFRWTYTILFHFGTPHDPVNAAMSTSLPILVTHIPQWGSLCFWIFREGMFNVKPKIRRKRCVPEVIETNNCAWKNL